MKKTHLSTKLFLMIIFTIGLVACTGEDGIDGLNGIDGINGVDGLNGTNGTNGENGNANVIASEWFGPDAQYFESNGYTKYAEFEKLVSEIDTAMYDYGTILVYAKFDNFVEEVWPVDHIALLPLHISGGTTEHFYTTYSSIGSIKIRYRRESGLVPETYNISSSAQFRYILIPQITTAKSAPENFSKMSYNEIINYFGLDY
ncbi:hypothetical protein [Cellulophaga baltica]|uniref:hypothetical protein n=1 Tax=Cellulophaga baltica TaxID=76594 RepID=UPI003F4ACCAC